MQGKTLVVGLLAHVDAGKTTLSEAMLFQSGALRRLGRVDHRDAFLDTDAQERERGITIFSKQAELTWRGRALTLLDTPGHADLSSETERALTVMDCAVLLISAADGVQEHTLTLWRLLRAYGVPTFLFVNKMDQPGSDRAALLAALRRRLGDGCVDLAAPQSADEIALCGEEALQEYLDSGAVSDTTIAQLVRRRALFPCLFGSALKLTGVEALLDAVTRYVPAPEYPDAFSARVFKIARDAQGARLAFCKVTGGVLRVKMAVGNEKINQLRVYSGAKYRLVEEAPAGCLCAATGLSAVRAGDGLGEAARAAAPLLSPVFTYRVLPPPDCDAFRMLEALRRIEEEEAQLHVVWNSQLAQIHVQVMGEVQLEVLSRLLLERYGLRAGFDEGGVLYRETIENEVTGVGHFEPLRHYAEVCLRLTPAERGSGLRFVSECPLERLERSWQRLILSQLKEKQHVGVLTGAPLTDVTITLIDGRAHLKHTEGGDFRQAACRAVRQGLMQAQSVLLEPWYELRLEVPDECLGRAMRDIEQMGGAFSPPETLPDGMAVLSARAPVAAARQYAREVTAYTRGRGHLTCAFCGYERCRDQEAVVAGSGYDPLRDVENSADSVFCSHGAGVIVPWDEAPARMHCQTGGAREAEAPASPRPERDTRGEEEQLNAIFERTYGPVRPRTAPGARANAPTVNDRSLAPLAAQPDCLLVDAYNVIFAWPDLKELARHSLEHARLGLLEILSNYQGFCGGEIIVVFDAYKVAGGTGAQESYHGLRVVYTREAETADNYIERTIYGLRGKARVRVATSDALEQLIILGNGALRVPAAELRAQVEAANVEIAAILRRNNDARPAVPALERALREAIARRQKDG